MCKLNCAYVCACVCVCVCVCVCLECTVCLCEKTFTNHVCVNLYDVNNCVLLQTVV